MESGFLTKEGRGRERMCRGRLRGKSSIVCAVGGEKKWTAGWREGMYCWECTVGWGDGSGILNYIGPCLHTSTGLTLWRVKILLLESISERIP